MNIGVKYADAGGVQYAGERSLYLSFIASLSSPTTSWISSPVATCNVTTNNGYVHVLRFTTNLNITITGSLIVLDFSDHYFGFDPLLFYNDALDYGIDP